MVSKIFIALFLGCAHYNVFAMTHQKQSHSSPAQNISMLNPILPLPLIQEPCTSKTPTIQAPRPRKASSLFQRMLRPFKKSPSCPNLSQAALETHNLAESTPERFNTSDHKKVTTQDTPPIFHDAYDDDDDYHTTTRTSHNHMNRITGLSEDDKTLLSYFSADEPLALSLSSQDPSLVLTHNQPLSYQAPSDSFRDNNPLVQSLSPHAQNTVLKNHNQEDSRPPTPQNSPPVTQELSPCEDPLLMNIINRSALLLTIQAEYTQHWPRLTLPAKKLLRQKKLRPDLPLQEPPLKSRSRQNWPGPSLPPQNPYVYYTISPCSSVYQTVVRTQQHGHLKQLACLILFLGKSPSLTISGEDCAKHSFINIEASAENICTQTLYK